MKGIKKNLIAVRLTDKEEKKLDKLCNTHDMNRSEIVRKLIREAK